MALGKRAMVLFLVISVALQVSSATVYKVGDSAGWTTIGNVDYKKWAATKNFNVGDVILFEYNTQFHNVMQVKHQEFRSCNASTPITTFSSGNDSITIKRPGHYYYFCGVPGHCQAGQKVDIRVVLASSAPAMAPSPSSISSPPTSDAPTTGTPSDGVAPAPALNGASAHFTSSIGLLVAKLGLGMAVSAAFVSGFF